MSPSKAFAKLINNKFFNNFEIIGGLSMRKIVLASKSPRRKELLEMLGFTFFVHPSSADEIYNKDALPNEIVEQLALGKAKDVSSNYDDAIIIGTDTIVVYEGNVLGKPKDKNDAFDMLKSLQDDVHQVYSGLALVDSFTGKSIVSHRLTKVYMYPLSDCQIKSYVNTGEPLDKAGSYGIQGLGSLFIEKIEGDYFNVVGLPISLLRELLMFMDIDIIKGI